MTAPHVTRPRKEPVILLLGSSGQLGTELGSALAGQGRLVCPSRAELNLTRVDSISAVVRAVRPTLVVNAAAYTAVDQAESDQDVARSVNGIAPGVLAEEAKRQGARFVHFSTDYVFDGRSERPYPEDAEPGPVNVYGATKLEGERAVRAVNGTHVILRTSWLYGGRRRNFLRTMLRLARERDRIQVVNDQVGSPTWVRDVSEATRRLLERVDARGGAEHDLYHLSATGETTWHDFARAIFTSDPRRAEHRLRTLEAVTTEAYGAPAPRPAFSVLDCSRAADEFGVSLPTWESSLKRALQADAPADE